MHKVKVMFYIMRHGFCPIGFDWLTKEGKEEVRRSAKKNLKDIKFTGAYSSPEIRAQETMGIVLDATKNGQLGIKHRKGLNPGDDPSTLREIKSTAREVSRYAALDGKSECNIMVVTHSANVLACSIACPTLQEVNNADIVKLVVEVTDSSQEVVTTQYIPAPRLASAAIS